MKIAGDMRQLAGRLWERVNPLCSTYVCSHFNHFITIGPLGGHRKPPKAGLNQIHTYTRKKKRKKEGPLNPSVRHLYVGKQDVGGSKASRRGGFQVRHSPHRPVLTLSCRRRNRRLSGPIQGWRSACYITTLLSRV